MRTVYSTNNAMQLREAGHPLASPRDARNFFDCAIAIGAAEDDLGYYSINIANLNADAPAVATYAKLDRAELIAMRDAINEELARVN